MKKTQNITMGGQRLCVKTVIEGLEGGLMRSYMMEKWSLGLDNEES